MLTSVGIVEIFVGIVLRSCSHRLKATYQNNFFGIKNTHLPELEDAYLLKNLNVVKQV